MRPLITLLPSSLVRWLGRLQFRLPLFGKLIRQIGRFATRGVCVIQHGVGKGLKIDASLGFPGYALGTTEPEEQEALRILTKRNGVVLDVGANIGFHALLSARLVGPGGIVHAFEPFPKTAAAIRKNAALNSFANVVVVEKAVCESAGNAEFQLGENTALNSLTASESLQSAETIRVETVSLDGYCSQHEASPSLILIDVEGAELRVMKGAINILKKHRPVIVLELHWKQGEFYDFYDSNLASLGYSLCNLDLTTYRRKIAPEREHIVVRCESH